MAGKAFNLTKGVLSFNGRTGTVQPKSGDYTAEDVGARPDTWTPTAEDTNALPAIEDYENPGCYYRMNNDIQEWVNPPMLLGVEYRTTERYNGKPVYIKVINFGALPNAMTTGASYQSLGVVDKVVSCNGVTFDSSGKSVTIPSNFSSGASIEGLINVYANSNGNVYINTFSNLSLYTPTYVTVKYTKLGD